MKKKLIINKIITESIKIKKSNICIYQNCEKRSTFGKKDKPAEYCKEHKPNDSYINVNNKKCLLCDKQPIFGELGKKAEYCNEHKPDDSYIDVINKKCLLCDKQPIFGKKDKLAEFCREHKPDDSYIDVKSKICLFCDKRPTFGKKDGLAEFCKEHKPDDSYIDVKSKTCLFCDKRPTFGIKDEKAEFCKEHKPDDNYVDVISKTCLLCDKRPTFGKKDEKAEFCKKHKPDDSYIDVKSKTCKICDKQSTFGKKDKKAEFCKEHKPDDSYIDVKSKTCLLCDKRSIFGKKDEPAEFCKEHKPDDSYIDVKNKTCLLCDKLPNYNYIGYSPIYCTTHKHNGMILRPIKRCKYCKNYASYIYLKEFLCSLHTNMNANKIHDICSICCNIVDKNSNICQSCNDIIINGGITKRRKEKEMKIHDLLTKNKFEFIHDTSIEYGCSKKRPDFQIITNFGVIILEIDEFQHNKKSYPIDCEITRMKQIYFDLGLDDGKVIFIRYNPDSYLSKNKKELKILEREDLLIKTINRYMNEKLENHLTVLYLFYDNYENITNSENILIIDPYK